MDKSTLSNYGWVVCVILVLAIMISLATPFGSVIKNEIAKTVTNLKDNSENVLDNMGGATSFDDLGGGGSGGAGGGAGGNGGSGGEEISPDITTAYTQADIDASNGKLIAMGATDPLYVVAAINGDSSVMTITKNGEESDGRMSDGMLDDSLKSTITEVVIEQGVINVGRWRFSGCSNLTNINIPDSVSVIGGNVFYGCSNLTTVTLPKDLTEIKFNAFQNSGLVSVVVPDSVTAIGTSAFATCRNLTSVALPNNLTTMASNLFENCSNLESIVLPDSLENVGSYAFRNCAKLTSVTLPDNLKTIKQDAFVNCERLTDLTLPEGVTTIETRAFSGSGLAVINLPNTITSIGSFALSCSDLSAINFNGKKAQWAAKSFDTAWDRDAGLYTVHCIDGDISLAPVVITQADVDASNGKLIAIGATSALNVIIEISDDSSEARVFKNGNSDSGAMMAQEYHPGMAEMMGEKVPALYNQTSIKNVVIEDGVTDITDYFFYGTGVTSVTIPVSVTTMGYCVFECCDSLTDIYYEGATDQWNNMSRNDAWSGVYGRTITIHCANGDIDFVAN